MLNDKLRIAAREGRLHDVKYYLAQGADVNSKSPYEKTALLEAGDFGHEGVFSLLLYHGANRTSIHRALVSACERGHAAIVRLCLERGSNPNISVFMGSPLHLACWYGHNDIVRILLSHGANIDAKNQDGEKPIDLAYHMDRHEIVKTIQSHQETNDEYRNNKHQPIEMQHPRHCEMKYQDENVLPAHCIHDHYESRLKIQTELYHTVDKELLVRDYKNGEQDQVPHKTSMTDISLYSKHQHDKISSLMTHKQSRTMPMSKNSSMRYKELNVKRDDTRYYGIKTSTDESLLILRKPSSFRDDSSDEESCASTRRNPSPVCRYHKQVPVQTSRKNVSNKLMNEKPNIFRRVTRSQTRRK